MKLANLSEADFKTVESLAISYLAQKLSSDASLDSAARIATGPRLRASQLMINRGFTVAEAEEAFREMCGIIDGVTA